MADVKISAQTDGSALQLADMIPVARAGVANRVAGGFVDLITAQTVAGGKIFTGTSSFRQVGGTVNDDEIQVLNDGTNGLIYCRNGYLEIKSPGSAGTPTAATAIHVTGALGYAAISIATATASGVIMTYGALGLGPASVVSWGAATEFGNDTQLSRLAAGVVGVTSWLQNTGGRKRLSSAVTNTTTTFANLTALTMTLLAGRTYTGTLVLPINQALAADGFKLDLNGGTATMTSIEFGFDSAIGSTLGTRTSTALSTPITLTALADTSDVFVTAQITMVVNAGGTFIPRQAKNGDAASGTLTLRTGGYLWLEDTP